MELGYLNAGRIRGVPIRLHWTIPVGALVLGGLRFSPIYWVAFFALVLIHELGHAFFVRRYGHRVHSVDVTGFGGLCRWSGATTVHQQAVIAWGGVIAQVLLLAFALLAVLAFGPVTSMVGVQLFDAFIQTNLWLIVLNLLPMPPFDGAQAWPLLRQWLSGPRLR